MSYPIEKPPLFAVSVRALGLLAAAVWYVGGAVLLLKGGRLLMEATALEPGGIGPWLAGAGGLFFGGLKAQYLFNRSCRRNLDRIAALDRPRVWQFFRPGFFVALAAMIFTGETLSSLAHGDYPMLIGVATLDFSIAVALLGSSRVFWSHEVIGKR